MLYLRTTRIALSVVFVLIVCAGLWGEPLSGIVYGEPDASVNGNRVGASTAVFAGDTVRTGANPARLISNGLLVDVAPNSSLLFGKTLQLVSGSMVITGASPFAVRVGEQTVESSAPATTLKIINKEDVGIVVLNGLATLQQGTSRTLLAKGETFGKAPPAAPPDGKNNHRPPSPPRRRPSPSEP